ncbi:MAG TPA: hypothetical protein VFQ92_17130 [Blastocatellia bacterium]|nr:hypothetical protein [Blastocatellia bacterium]
MSEKPSYVKEAAKEPLNIWAMVGFVAASVFTATSTDIGALAWVPLAAGAFAETLYLATLPATAAYRRVVDRRQRRRELAERGRRREELIKMFDPREREAVEYYRWLKNQIYQNYQKFTHSKMIPDDILRLETIWESYVDLLDTYRRRKNHLRSANRQTIQNQIQQAERAIQTAPDEGTRRLYEKNLSILQKRLQAYTDIENSLKRIEAQLQSIEYSFGLVNDQIITMPTPEHISTLDLDSLLSSIELTKEILEETAPVLSQLDAAERSSEQGIRPPIAQRQ